jgi:hypothetical protein
MNMFFNRQSAFLWVQTVLHYSSTCSFTHTKQTFIEGLLKKNKKTLIRSFSFTFRYIDDVLSLINSKFCDFGDHIYPVEFEIKDTTDTERSTSYLDLHLKIDNRGRLRTKLYDKRDYFNFPIVNFLFITFHQHLDVEFISLG